MPIYDVMMGLKKHEAKLLIACIDRTLKEVDKLPADVIFVLEKAKHVLSGKKLWGSKFHRLEQREECPRCGQEQIYLERHLLTCGKKLDAKKVDPEILARIARGT